jgi:hypothetical protein
MFRQPVNLEKLQTHELCTRLPQQFPAQTQFSRQWCLLDLSISDIEKTLYTFKLSHIFMALAFAPAALLTPFNPQIRSPRKACVALTVAWMF